MSFLYSTPEKVYCKLSSQSGRKIEEKSDVYTDLQFTDKDTTPPKTYDLAGRAVVKGYGFDKECSAPLVFINILLKHLFNTFL